MQTARCHVTKSCGHVRTFKLTLQQQPLSTSKRVGFHVSNLMDLFYPEFQFMQRTDKTFA